MVNKKYVLSLSLLVLSIIIITSSATYAYVVLNGKQESGTNVFKTSCFGISSIESASSNSINVVTFPIKEGASESLTPYSFVVKNKEGCTSSINYSILLVIKDSTSDILLPHIRFSLNNGTSNNVVNKTLLSSIPVGMDSTNVKAVYEILSSTPLTSTQDEYDLRLWIEDGACNDNASCQAIMNSTFEAELYVYAMP